MARPVVLWPETDVAVLITALVVIAERVPSGLSRRLIESAARENASRSLNTHHCGTSPGVLDRRFALETGFSPMIDVALAGDVAVRHAVVRQADDVLPAATP